MTASFRYPMFVVSYQPTYLIPPISTIYGFLSAAKGSKVNLTDMNVGYTFTSKGKGVDLERIHKYGDESEKNHLNDWEQMSSNANFSTIAILHFIYLI